MEISPLLAAARAGKAPHVTIVVGPEPFLAERAISLLRAATVGDVRGLNEDTFHGKTSPMSNVLAVANTLPMFTKARFVLVRDLDDFDAASLDQLATYVGNPSPSTTLIAVATKIDGRARLVKTAKQKDCYTEVAPLKGAALRAFIADEVKERGHPLGSGALDALLDAVGTDLHAIDDALERLSLFVGPGRPIDIDAIDKTVAPLRVETIWALVDAISARDSRTALRAARSLLDDREPALRILALIERQLRIVAKMHGALEAGRSGQDAALAAGAPPFKARELTAAAKRFGSAEFRSAFRTLADADLALKGSRVPAEVALEHAVLELCMPSGSRRRQRQPPRPGVKRD